MFQTKELEQLRERKAELVRQCEENRQQLADDWHRLSSSEFWVTEAQGTVKRHPLVAAGLAAIGGVLAVRMVRNPGGMAGTLGGLGKLASVATTVWRLFRKKDDVQGDGKIEGDLRH